MHRSAASALALVLLPIGQASSADDFDTRRVNDLRVSIGAVAAPHIEESVNAGGVWSEYQWEQDNAVGIELRAQYVTRLARLGSLGGVVGGLGLDLGWADASPASYDFAGGSADAQPHAPSTSVYTLLGEVSVGWSSPVWRSAWGGFLHIELSGFVAAGPAFAEVEDLSTTKVDAVTGSGWAYAMGPRLGMYLCTPPWLIGIEGEWRAANARTEAELRQGRSVLDLDGDGLGVFLTFGYRL